MRSAWRPRDEGRAVEAFAQARQFLQHLGPWGAGHAGDGALLIYDALRARFHAIRIAKDPECPTCGAHALAAGG